MLLIIPLIKEISNCHEDCRRLNWAPSVLTTSNPGEALTGRTKTALISLVVWVLSCGQPGAALAHGSPASGDHSLITPETRARLEDVEKRRRELQARVMQARQREQLAIIKLNHIQTKLNVTNGALQSSKHKLRRTESKINETEVSLSRTRSAESDLSRQAAKRLREIYEGQRLNILEMVFQVQSLQALLDLFYYQERVAELDRKLIAELRLRAAALAQRKDRLGAQKNQLGDMISEIAKKALAINQERLNQEQIAERLRKQRAFWEQAEQQLALESQKLEQQIRDMESEHTRSSKEMARGTGEMDLPLAAQVTSPFGWRRHPIFGVRKFHTGVDLAGPNHAGIKAADSGSVLYTGWYGGYGKVVIVSHGKGMATLYAHLSAIKVSAGQNVHKGEILGYEGTTGFSTGPHLHFEVRVNGKPNNPLNFVK